jgi:[ribosomal protein S5]-alanine N-acetyltransferase
MIDIARRTDLGIALTAKTLPQDNPSTTILRRNGFQVAGETSDDDIGLAWAWVLRPE